MEHSFLFELLFLSLRHQKANISCSTAMPFSSLLDRAHRCRREQKTTSDVTSDHTPFLHQGDTYLGYLAHSMDRELLAPSLHSRESKRSDRATKLQRHLTHMLTLDVKRLRPCRPLSPREYFELLRDQPEGRLSTRPF